MIKAYYAILLFVCLGIKPFYTIGYVAYYELNIDTIIEKYCVNKSKPKFKCNGKCHLAKKLSFTATVATDTTNQAISNSLREAFFPVFFQVQNFSSAVLTKPIAKKAEWFFAPKNYNVSLSISSPPPQC